MATYQGQALLNYPESFNQYYLSTSTGRPLRTAQGQETDYSIPKPNAPENFYNYHNSLYESNTESVRLLDNDDDDVTELEDYYYDEEQFVTSPPDEANVHTFDQHYVNDYDDVIRTKGRPPQHELELQDKIYNPKVGKVDPEDYSNSPNDLDNRIRNIRRNDNIFRQEGGDLSTFASYALSAMKVLSLIMSVVDGSGGSGTSNTERIDLGPPSAPTSEIDVALGTLMAFGGKYLRSIALNAWEHATQATGLGVGVSPTTTVKVPIAPAQEAVVVETQQQQPQEQLQSAIPTGTPYISTLSAQQLEDLGLKAVAAGAEPLKLQQAFGAAQMNGDWSQLELEMAAVLGPEAVGLNANAGGASGVIAPANNNVAVQMQDYVSGPGQVSTSSVSVASPGSISTSTTSVAPSGLGYYMEIANNYADRLTKVINGPDPSLPNNNYLTEDDQIAQQSIVTRFIKEFELEQEALALQYQANSIIRQVNNFIEGTPAEKLDNFGENLGGEELVAGGVPSGSIAGESSGGIGQFISSIPNMIGQAAVSVIRFITPVAPQQIEEKVDGPSGPSGVSYSEVSPTVDLDTVTYAMLGAGAIGTVLYGIYAASETEDNRRTSKYKRSIDDDAHVIAAESQYSQLPYPLKPRLISPSASNRPMKSLIPTAIGLCVGGLIFYGTLSRRRRSNIVLESTLQSNNQMLNTAIRKYSEIDS